MTNQNVMVMGWEEPFFAYSAHLNFLICDGGTIGSPKSLEKTWCPILSNQKLIETLIAQLVKIADCCIKRVKGKDCSISANS